MDAIEVNLPGGVTRQGGIHRQVKFRPLTGRIEQALLEFKQTSGRPAYVTAVLDCCLDNIDNEIVNTADFCVADRQYLMLRLAAMLDSEQMWLKVVCGHCEALFDVDIRRCDLPIKQAGPGYPFAEVRIADNLLVVRTATGMDQQCIVNLSEQEALKQLLQRCILSVNGAAPEPGFINHLCESDIQAIDDALDEVSPAIGNQLLVSCPECGREQQAELDHYALSSVNEHFFYDEIHSLASHYHWSEAAILDLPQSRRQIYLNLINREAGRGYSA